MTANSSEGVRTCDMSTPRYLRDDKLKSCGAGFPDNASSVAHQIETFVNKLDLRNMELFSSFARNSKQKQKMQGMICKFFAAVVQIDAMSHRKFAVPMTVQKPAGAIGLACIRWRELRPLMGFPSRADYSFS